MPILNIGGHLYIDYTCPCGGMNLKGPAESFLGDDTSCICTKCGKCLRASLLHEIGELMAGVKDKEERNDRNG